jgi:undecaprenyl-diphosphatase
VSDLHAVILALLQGLTEFLPVSSSAHLILPSQLLGWPDQGIAFDVAVHLGTLAAVLLYFRRDIAQMALSWGRSMHSRQCDDHGRLAWFIVLATLPAASAGWLLNGFISSHLRASVVIAITTISFGLLMAMADRVGRKTQPLATLTLKQALLIGCAQAVALIPGTSRSGITMTMGLLLGLTPQAAARFSFLLSIPVIMMAAGYEGLHLLSSQDVVAWREIGIGIAVSFVSALLVIHWFLKVLTHIGLWPFVLYRLLLGVSLLWLVA